MTPLVRIRLRHDLDAVGMRQTARHVARLLGFEYHDQIRIATAVSELVRAATGDDEAVALAELAVTNDSAPQRLVIRVRGANLECDATAAGAGGTLAAERLLDRLDVEDRESDEVVLARTLPHGAPLVTALRAEEIRKAIQQIDYTATHAYLTELKQQNRELSSTLLELERKQEELTRLNAELADTNRGVMALYSELDEHANHLRQADEIKTKFFSNMSHEFRTPLNSISTLSKLLLDESDGPLNAEQARQVRLIHDAAGEMLELVSDLLDLSKVEAGKVSLQVGQFDVGELFGTLRGMMRPLLHGSPISLEFDEPSHVPRIIGDQAKVGQVLRNFLSNAVKFTEEGSIKVSARRLRDGEPISGQSKPAAQESVLFCVADTGIGIGPDDQEFIFDEFTQVRHSLQRKVRGTGLGLPLCRKLASMMGGRVWVESELGVGSRFYLLVPRFYRPAFDRLPPLRQPVPEKHRGIGAKAPLLILTQSGERSRRIEALFEKSVFEIVPAGIDAITKDYLERLQPRAAITDFGLTGAPAREAVARLQRCAIPLIHLGADGDFVAARHASLDPRLVDITCFEALRSSMSRVLLVDDDDSFRTVLRKHVAPYCKYPFVTGDAALALAAAQAGDADCMVLDLMMPDMDGFTLLTLLRDHSVTSTLPVLACSSKMLSSEEQALLLDLRAPFLPKHALDQGSLASGLIEADTWSRQATREAVRVRAGAA